MFAGYGLRINFSHRYERFRSYIDNTISWVTFLVRTTGTYVGQHPEHNTSVRPITHTPKERCKGHRICRRLDKVPHSWQRHRKAQEKRTESASRQSPLTLGNSFTRCAIFSGRGDAQSSSPALSLFSFSIVYTIPQVSGTLCYWRTARVAQRGYSPNTSPSFCTRMLHLLSIAGTYATKQYSENPKFGNWDPRTILPLLESRKYSRTTKGQQHSHGHQKEEKEIRNKG